MWKVKKFFHQRFLWDSDKERAGSSTRHRTYRMVEIVKRSSCVFLSVMVPITLVKFLPLLKHFFEHELARVACYNDS